MCLSIRQPWAWLIVHGHKTIENRHWSTLYRGQILIHAGKAMTQADYHECWGVARAQGVDLPAAVNLPRGGIVGVARLVDCVRQHDSPWFFGPVGWVLVEARPVALVPCAGQLGLFEVAQSVADMVMREARSA